MNWFTEHLTWLTAPWSAISDLQRDVMRLQMQLREMRSHLMARVDELRNRLNAATDELARDLDDLRGRLAQQDEALASELEPMVARLEAMGQDPANPVPDAPAPGGGGGDVVNPTPGAQDNPNA